MSDCRLYAVAFVSNDRDLFISFLSNKKITVGRFYRLIDRLVAKCLNGDFVGAINQLTKHDITLISEKQFYDLEESDNIYTSEINLDRGMVTIDYGDLLKGCKFEEFHERGMPLICDYPIYNWRAVKA